MTEQQILAAVIDGTLFGMVECDIRVPEHLQDHFAEMQPVFKNVTVTRDDIGPFMRQYAEENDIMSAPRRKLLLATPLLRWYIAQGLVVDRVYQVVEYEPNPCFQRFGESVSAARRAGDSDPEKAIIADTMKLLGNSGYGKTVTNVDRHHDVKYCTEVGTSALINNKRFRQLDVVTDDAYEIEMNKSVVKYTLPLHIGLFVYQYAKLRMLQCYYDFVRVWEDGHQRRSTSLCQVLYRGRHIGAHQQQAVPPTGCCDRRCIRDRDEQERREVHPSPPHRFLRLPVRQTPHATILL